MVLESSSALDWSLLAPDACVVLGALEACDLGAAHAVQVSYSQVITSPPHSDND